MVRNYKRKTTKGSYPKETLEQAIEEIKAGSKTAYNASKTYHIPLNTIIDHLKGRRGKKSKSFGRSTVLSTDYEKRLVEGLLKMEKYGFGLSRKEVLELVGQFVNSNNLQTPFKDGVPGEDWFLGFCKRHKLSLKKPQSVEVSRKKSCNPFTIHEYFTLLENTITKLGLQNKPENIWNLDETSFCTDPSKTKVVGGKNLSCTRTVSTSGRENITVLMAASALGDKVPPLIIFKGKNMWDQWHAPENTGYPGTTYAATSNGWMEATVFENYFEKAFLKKIGTDRPVLLIYDGHSTHVTINLIELASRNNVTILKLPPHTSHVLQPLDISVFKPLKTSWDERLVKWQRKHIGTRLPKKDFSIMIGEIWHDLKKEVIKNGFRRAGIYPFSSDVIPDSMFDALSLKQWKETVEKQKKTDNPEIVEDPATLNILEAVLQPPIPLETVGNERKADNPEKMEDPAILNILEAVLHPPILLDFPSNDVLHVQDIPLESTEAQSSANRESYVEDCAKFIPPKIEITFEDLLLKSIKSNAPKLLNKKRKVGCGAEVITAEDVKARMIKEKKLIKKEKAKFQRNKSFLKKLMTVYAVSVNAISNIIPKIKIGFNA